MKGTPRYCQMSDADLARFVRISQQRVHDAFKEQQARLSLKQLRKQLSKAQELIHLLRCREASGDYEFCAARDKCAALKVSNEALRRAMDDMQRRIDAMRDAAVKDTAEAAVAAAEDEQGANPLPFPAAFVKVALGRTENTPVLTTGREGAPFVGVQEAFEPQPSVEPTPTVMPWGDYPARGPELKPLPKREG